MPLSLPTEYQEYLRTRGVFEGFTSGDPGYIALWPISALPGMNSDIEMQTHAPGFLAYASNGGGEVLAFDASGAVYMLPLIGMEARYAVKVAESFAELAARFERSAL